MQEIYKQLSYVAGTASIPTKASLLKTCPNVDLLKKVLKAAYNPYVTYGVNLSFCPDNLVYEGYWKWEQYESFLNKLASRKLTGNAARTELFEHLGTMTESQRFILTGILNKDLGIGIGAKTINEAFPKLIPVFDVSLAASVWKPAKVKFPCLAELKYDGFRAVTLVTDEEVTMRSRNGLIIEGYTAQKNKLRDWQKDTGFNGVLDGELMVGMFGDRAERMAEAPYFVFDVLGLAEFQQGRSEAPQGARRARLVGDLGLFTAWPRLEDEPLRPFLLQPAQTYTSYARLIENEQQLSNFYEAALAAGYEGLVVKDIKAPYKFGRGYHWQKLVPNLTADVTVISVTEAKKGHLGLLGAFLVELDGVQSEVAPGHATHQERKDFWENPPIGQVIEIKYREKTPAGALRFGRFVRLRNDKL